MAIKIGDALHVTTARGDVLTVRALTGPERGDKFPIVWVATEEDWENAQRDGVEPSGIPWPVEAIQELAVG